jgi:hypothetical protein
VSSSVNPCPVGQFEGSKPYIDAGKVAEALGVPRGVVVDDVRAGMDGKIGTLTGKVFDGGICVVHAENLDSSDKLEYHRERLTDHSSGGAS